MTIKSNVAPKSYVLEYPAADPKAARSYFLDKLSVETDAWDVHHDLENGETGFVIVDTRSPEPFAKEHIKGAINFHYRAMNPESVKVLPKDKLILVCCAGVGCNAGAKGAARLAELGFQVKEIIGGLDWWKKMEYPIATGK